MKIGFHTDAFNSSVFSFQKCVDWAEKNGVHAIECGVIDGVSWIHGLGYFPHIALYQDPLELKEKMAAQGVALSQIDAAYPLSGKDGPIYGVPYILKSIPWAKHAGCPNIATTDGLYKPEGLSDAEALAMMKRSYLQIIEAAERYEVSINIEVHGYFTTNPDFLDEMLHFSDKGIGISHCAIGDGVNAGNIIKCLEMLRDAGYGGVLSMETEGAGGPMIEKSLEWLRGTLARLGIKENS